MTASLPQEPTPAGEPPQFETLYRAHFRRVWSVLRRLGVPEAQLDDAAQDVFVVVHRRFDRLRSACSARAWVYGIAVRVASEHRRRAMRRPSAPLPDGLPDHSQNTARGTEVDEAVRLLHQILTTLDDELRTAFVLSEIEQLTAPEIAELLGVNLNTVYSRVRAARRRFEQSHLRHQARTREPRSRETHGET